MKKAAALFGMIEKNRMKFEFMRNYPKIGLVFVAFGMSILAGNSTKAQEFDRLPSTPGIDTRQVQYLRGEQKRDPALERFLLEEAEIQGMEEFKTVYTYHKIDLNNDGYDEAIVQVSNSVMCGTGGCPAFIIQGMRNGYNAILSRYLSHGRWVVGIDTSNGWRNIYSFSRCPNELSQVCYGVNAFNGHRYDGITRLSRAALRGQVVLASNDYHLLATHHYSRCNSVDSYCYRLGDYGEGVESIIQLLTHKGYYRGTNDGIFGPRTQAAIENLQRNNNLTPDGVVGPSTIDVLCLSDRANLPNLSEVERQQIGVAFRVCRTSLIYQPTLQ